MTTLPQEGISPDEMRDASNAPTSESLEEVFGEPISVYSDERAVEDGTLVDLTQFTDVRFQRHPINRMTRPLFERLKPVLDDMEGDAKEFGLHLKWMFRKKFALAQAFPDNIGMTGDIYWLPPNLWLARNEVGGWTAMHPDDY